LLFLHGIALFIQDLLCFHMNYRIFVIVLVLLWRMPLIFWWWWRWNLYIAFSSLASLTVLILPIYEHGSLYIF
jgi:hypothetical protein